MAQALLISVGGSETPVINSINIHKPKYVIYFTSRQSRQVVREKVEPQLEHTPEDHEIVTTPDEENLVLCVKELLKRVPEIMAMWGIGYGDVHGDYTGGTKTMSAAVVLALLGRGSNYSYIGGDLRDKGGLGIVQNGHEVQLTLANPWDVLAINTLRDLAILINNQHFRPAAALARDAAEKAEGLKPLFKAMEAVALGYYHWDSFKYKEARNYIGNAQNALEKMLVFRSNSALEGLLRHMQNSFEELTLLVKEFSGGEWGQATVRDIVANAVRRAHDKHHYDDAVARLYSAIEKVAKIRLQQGWNLDSGNLDLSRIEDADLRLELGEKCTDGRDGRVKLPLFRSYSLLQHLGDDLGERFAAREKELRDLLNIRNDSLLAHGFKPVSEDTYNKMVTIALDFLGISLEELHGFPVLNVEELGCIAW